MSEGKYLDHEDVARRLGMTTEELETSTLKPAARIGDTPIFKAEDVAAFEEARNTEAVANGLYLTRAQVKAELGLTPDELDGLERRDVGGLKPVDRRGGVPVYLAAAVKAFKARRDGTDGKTKATPGHVSEGEAARALGLSLSEFRERAAGGGFVRPAFHDRQTGTAMYPAAIIAAMAERRAGGGGPAPRGPAKIELVGEVEASALSGLPVETLRSMAASGKLRPFSKAPDGSMTFSRSLMVEFTRSAHA